MWRYGCPKSLDWRSSCSASDTFCGGENCDHNKKCQAIEVIGQDWSSEVVALFLEGWELGRVALSCNMAIDLLCQEMRDASGLAQSRWAPCFHCDRSASEVPLQNRHSNKACHRGRAVTI